MQPTEFDVVTAAAKAGGHDLRGRSSSPTVPLDRRESALHGVRRVLANLAATIDDNLEGTIDDLDVEFLHELRVAVRRTRSVLAEAKGVLPARRPRPLPSVLRVARRDHQPGPRPRRLRPRVGRLHRAPGPPATAGASTACWSSSRSGGGRPTPSSPARCAATTAGELLDSWRLWLADPTVEPDRRPAPRSLRRQAHRQGPAQGPHRRPRHHPGLAARAPPRPAQGHQEAPLPARVLRQPVPDQGPQGVRRPAQGAAGQPRRAPGRRGAPGPAPRARPRPARPRHRRHRRAAGDGAAQRPPRPAPHRGAGRLRRALRRLRHQGQPPRARRRCSARRRAG